MSTDSKSTPRTGDPWTPKAGDRVRYLGKVNGAETGTVVEIIARVRWDDADGTLDYAAHKLALESNSEET